MEKSISVEELDASRSPEIEQYLETCSVEKLEELAIEVYKTIKQDNHGYYLRRIMIKRREKLNQNFIWNEKKKRKILELNEIFFQFFKKAHDEALSDITQYENRKKNRETAFKSFYIYVILVPCFNSDVKRIHKSGIRDVLLDGGAYSAYARIGDVEDLILYDFEWEPGPYLDNYEEKYGQYFGRNFNGVNLSYVFHDLIDAGWSINDILCIEDVEANVRIEKSYWKEMDGWK